MDLYSKGEIGMTKTTKDKKTKQMRPALTAEGRENQMIALAVDLAEKQLREGTASSQVITHFLKLGSTRERLEQEILEEQKKLVQAKTENLESMKKQEELYNKALAAMTSYKTDSDDSSYEEDVDDGDHHK